MVVTQNPFWLYRHGRQMSTKIFMIVLEVFLHRPTQTIAPGGYKMNSYQL